MTTPDRRTFLEISGATGVAALTGLAGCSQSGGEQSDGQSGSSTSTTTGGGGSDPITIVATLPMTGAFSSLADSLKRGYRLGVQKMSADEPLGREVEFLYEDDESDPRKAKNKLDRLISNNDVDVILSSITNLLIPVQVRVAEQEEIPYIAVAQAFEKLHVDNDTKWLFSAFPQSRDVAATTRDVLDGIPEGERPQRVGVWQPNGSWGPEMAETWKNTLSEAGYDIVLHETHQANAKDFSTLIEKTKSAGVEALLGVPNPIGGITAMKQINSADYTPKFLEFPRGADTRSWNTALGDGGQHVCMSPGWAPGLTGNGNAELRESYRANYDLPDGQTLPVTVGYAYNAAQTAQQAVESAGSTDNEELQAALRDGTFHTVIGDFGFDDVGRPTGMTAVMGQWQDGNQHLVYPKTDGDAYRDLVYPL